jgi:hypothetical protein
MTLQEALAKIEKATLSSPVKAAFRLLVEALEEELTKPKEE